LKTKIDKQNLIIENADTTLPKTTVS